LGIILIIIGLFFPFLAQPFSWLVFLPSKIFVEGVSFWGKILPFFSFSLPWWILIIYGVILAAMILKR